MEAVMKQTDKSRRLFFKASSILGVAAAFDLGTIRTSFAHSNFTAEEQSMTTTVQESSTMATNNSAIRPFQKSNVPESELTELRRRINNTKWPERETVTDATQGVQLATTQALASYWAKEYDWRKVEARLNALPQFVTEIDGLDIHFIHVRSKHENALPLIVTHGWPGSVVEQLKIVDPLTNPTAHGGAHRTPSMW
jgi:hypothetical protein